MNVRIAELPAVEGAGQDHVFTTGSAVVVLDGASGSDTSVSVARYVDALAAHLRKQLDQLDPEAAADLRDVVTAAIAATVEELDVTPGYSPSSTVSIVRASVDTVDVLVLCDSPVFVATATGIDAVTDDRLAELPSRSRAAALAWLASGNGFDEVHRRLLAQMGPEKAPRRNVEGGFWLAEADPEAGRHAIVRSFPRADVSWCAVLTDGVADPMRHLGISVEQVADLDELELSALLARLHAWEADEDPDATALPRFKRHDDKTIAVLDLR